MSIEEAAFTVGDIVQLKSGGPEMTVDNVHTFSNDAPRYTCKWFAGKKVQSERFDEGALKAVEEEGD